MALSIATRKKLSLINKGMKTNYNREYWIKYFEGGIENGKYLS